MYLIIYIIIKNPKCGCCYVRYARSSYTNLNICSYCVNHHSASFLGSFRKPLPERTDNLVRTLCTHKQTHDHYFYFCACCCYSRVLHHFGTKHASVASMHMNVLLCWSMNVRISFSFAGDVLYSNVIALFMIVL